MFWPKPLVPSESPDDRAHHDKPTRETERRQVLSDREREREGLRASTEKREADAGRSPKPGSRGGTKAAKGKEDDVAEEQDLANALRGITPKLSRTA